MHRVKTHAIIPHLKENTILMKQNIFNSHILPYFGKRKLNEITPMDVAKWQTEIMKKKRPDGKPYSSVYLKTIHNQLSASFNFAVRFYRLPKNPALIAGNMGKEGNKEMLFWTKEEYRQFSRAIMDKPMSFYAFEMLYWTGIREGELLALTPNDYKIIDVSSPVAFRPGCAHWVRRLTGSSTPLQRSACDYAEVSLSPGDHRLRGCNPLLYDNGFSHDLLTKAVWRPCRPAPLTG